MRILQACLFRPPAVRNMHNHAGMSIGESDTSMASASVPEVGHISLTLCVFALLFALLAYLSAQIASCLLRIAIVLMMSHYILCEAAVRVNQCQSIFVTHQSVPVSVGQSM